MTKPWRNQNKSLSKNIFNLEKTMRRRGSSKSELAIDEDKRKFEVLILSSIWRSRKEGFRFFFGERAR